MEVERFLKDINFIDQMDIAGKQLLIRTDFNVPVNEEGSITDDNRIKMFVPTLKYALDKNCRVVLMSHMGRPKGTPSSLYSLEVVAKRLSELSGHHVAFANDCISDETFRMINKMEAGDVILLENLRFHSEEKAGDREFAQKLARYGEIFINDAFGTSHRSDASIAVVPTFFSKDHKGAGLLIKRELEYFYRSLCEPAQPLCIILGGAKAETKIGVIMNMLDKAERIIIGGAMANTFLGAQGIQMGKSLVEREQFGVVLEIMAMCARKDCKLFLPVDFQVSTSMSAKGLSRSVTSQDIPPDCLALDIGPATRVLFKEAVQNAETIVWNGPMGAFENEEFAEGTLAVLEAVAQTPAFKVVGGGDTAAVVHSMQLEHKFDFVSTGGGAFLTLMEGGDMPGLRALM